jgi:hypothetical protein
MITHEWSDDYTREKAKPTSTNYLHLNNKGMLGALSSLLASPATPCPSRQSKVRFAFSVWFSRLGLRRMIELEPAACGTKQSEVRELPSSGNQACP